MIELLTELRERVNLAKTVRQMVFAANLKKIPPSLPRAAPGFVIEIF